MNDMTKFDTSTAVALPVVFARGETVFANSRDVADYFGKQHGHVVREIDRFVQGGVSNFGKTPYVHPQNGQTYRAYDMDRDGFALLVMGFTGAKARQFKMAYIEAFNRMETELRSRQPAVPAIPDFGNPAAAARAWAEQWEQRQLVEAQKLIADAKIEQMTPKAEAFDDLMSSEGTLNSTTVAKQIGFRSAHALHKQLHADGVLCKDRRDQWVPSAKYAKRGIFKVITNSYGPGGHKVKVHTTWTPAGLVWASEQYGVAA